ncbi:phosphate:sodium symporter [Spirochaetia bacterium]|nr:phosphate:sodium symporter [Spirochaetia bacterium]
MSDGIQQAAGNRLQQALNFMTGNRFIAVITGFLVTAIVQSSSATTVMVVSFVNAGLLTLTQSIGVIMGANIGTTVTAWIVSLIGFSLKLSNLALPAVGIGFIMGVIKWKHRDLGEVILGFGLLFLGLDFLTKSMPTLSADSQILTWIALVSDLGFLSILISTGLGLVMTLITHSSSASTAIMLTMAHGGLISYDLAAAMILGANIGTTIDAALAAIGTKSAAKRTALVHVLFNVVGTVIALILFRPLLFLVDFITPGSPDGAGITTHLAMFHTVFNILATAVFLPFIRQFAMLVTFLIKDKDTIDEPHERKPYKLEYQSVLHSTPELNIIRAEKEIRDMVALASSMYAAFSEALRTLRDNPNREGAVDALVADMQEKEQIADEMREELTRFLMECTRQPLGHQSEKNVYHLLRIIADLEDMTDDCYSVSLMLERSVKKDMMFKEKEVEALTPYIDLVQQFLDFVQENLGRKITIKQTFYTAGLEKQIDKYRDKLRKMGRKRIEAGENVKTELLFIDMVRRIEKLGDVCSNISEALSHKG